MKKIATIFTLVLLLCSCGDNKYDKADILIFTQQGCSHCEKAMDFINNRLLVKNPSLKVEQVDISYDSKNISLLKKYLIKYKVTDGSIGTPIIVFDKQLVIGWGLANKVKLQKLFEFNQK